MEVIYTKLIEQNAPDFHLEPNPKSSQYSSYTNVAFRASLEPIWHYAILACDVIELFLFVEISASW